MSITDDNQYDSQIDQTSEMQQLSYSNSVILTLYKPSL